MVRVLKGGGGTGASGVACMACRRWAGVHWAMVREVASVGSQGACDCPRARKLAASHRCCCSAGLPLAQFGSFWTNGQICSATSRLLVHADIAPAFFARLKQRAESIRVDDPLQAGVRLGPLVSTRCLARVGGGGEGEVGVRLGPLVRQPLARLLEVGGTAPGEEKASAWLALFGVEVCLGTPHRVRWRLEALASFALCLFPGSVRCAHVACGVFCSPGVTPGTRGARSHPEAPPRRSAGASTSACSPTCKRARRTAPSCSRAAPGPRTSPAASSWRPR